MDPTVGILKSIIQFAMLTLDTSCCTNENDENRKCSYAIPVIYLWAALAGHNDHLDFCHNSLSTVINPDYNMTKQICIKRIDDKIHP